MPICLIYFLANNLCVFLRDLHNKRCHDKRKRATKSKFTRDKYGRKYIIWISILGVILAAIAGGSIPAVIPSIIGDQVPQHQQSRSLGYIFSFGDLGSAIGPPIALALVEIISLPNLFVGCAFLLLATGLFTTVFAVQETKYTPS